MKATIIIILIFASLVFSRTFYLKSKPVYRYDGVVCEMQVPTGPFDHNFPITDVGGNWTTVDANGVETRNQLSVELVDDSIFTIVEVINYEPNDPNLYGHFRVIADLPDVEEKEFRALISDSEKNISETVYIIITVDRKPPYGGCSRP